MDTGFIRAWLKERTCLSLLCLEREAGLPVKTLDHFMARRRELNEQHWQKLEPVLSRYGWKSKDMTKSVIIIYYPETGTPKFVKTYVGPNIYGTSAVLKTSLRESAKTFEWDEAVSIVTSLNDSHREPGLWDIANAKISQNTKE